MTKVSTKRGRGRPPLSGDNAMTDPIPVRLPVEMVEAIEALCQSRMDKPTRAAMVRELIAEALARRAVSVKK